MRLRRSTTLRLLLAVVLLAVLGMAGSVRMSEGPAFGTGAMGTAAGGEVGPLIRFGQFNIHGGKGPDGRQDLQRTARCLSQVDVAGLNEVHGRDLPGWRRDQAAELAALLGRAWLWAPAERRFWHRLFGNGLLSKLPVETWMRIPLPQLKASSQRNVLLTRLRLGQRVFTVLITHLDAGPDRDPQLAAVIALFGSLAEPVLLMGDLNATLDHPLLKPLLAAPGVVASNGTLPPARPGGVDWIIARGFDPVAASLCDVGASDHASVIVALRLRDSGSSGR